MEGELVNVEASRSKCWTNLIFAMSAQKLIRKGCEVYLAYVLDSRISRLKLDQVPII